jgi:hypothetical protein
MSPLSGRAVLGGVIVVAIGAAIAVGMVFVRSPGDARLRKIDQRRVNDLSQIAASIDAYWNTNRRLPATLEESARGGQDSVPSDPVTHEPYPYRVVDDRHYEVCASFDLPADQPPNMNQLPFLSHADGRRCFTIEVREGAKRPAG